PAQIGAAARRTPADADALGDPGGFVQRFRDRLPFHQVLEPDGAFDFGENRTAVRIPFRDALAALDHIAFVDVHARAVLDAVGRTLGTVGIDDRNDPVA